MDEFDFDLMARLAKEDPAEFARRRELLIQQAIAAFPDPELGQRLQAEIDLERVCAPQGEKSYLALGRRMSGLLGQMSALYGGLSRLAETLKAEKRKAE